jgi:isopentenyl phosphate kinase
MSQLLLFLKLGGSLITDKTAVEAPRLAVLARLAGEIAAVWRERPAPRLIIGHGSGSYGHVAAAKYHTRGGVHSAEEWMGFCEVSAAALRLNQLVREKLLEAGLPVVSVQPSASAICENGELVEMSVSPIRDALEARLIPLVHGDVAFDRKQGGTIISTEQILSFLAGALAPDWLLLAGNTPGVLDSKGETISQIDHYGIHDVSDALEGSEGTDVTGGMAAKVYDMLALVRRQHGLNVRIFSGLEPGALSRVLLNPHDAKGTLICA